MKEKIIDLMRVKLGVSVKQNYKELNITDKDTIFSAYRKVAMYLSANHTITPEDELMVAKRSASRIFKREERFETLTKATKEEFNNIIVGINYKTKNSSSKDTKDDWTSHTYIAKPKGKGKRSLLICLSPTSQFKSSAIDKELYDSQGTFTIMMINLPLEYGYLKLAEDFKKVCEQHDSQETKEIINSDMFADLLNPAMTKCKFEKYYPTYPSAIERKAYAKPVNLSECSKVDKWEDDSIMAVLPENSRLLSNYNSDSKYRLQAIDSLSQVNTCEIVEVTIPDDDYRVYAWKNQIEALAVRERICNLLKYYLRKTKNIILQFDHDVKAEQELTHARFFEEKKNIKKETQAEMIRLGNLLDNKFSHVEIDNDVDLNKLNDVKRELKETIDLLPNANDGTKAILRFRKLRNHKALGIFTPVNNTVAVDFRSDANGKVEKAKNVSKYDMNIGLESLIHEYGHYLDYNVKTPAMTLSQDADFESILFNAQSWYDQHFQSSDARTRRKKSYYQLPTEVFARAFEVYCSHCGLDNSFTVNSNFIAIKKSQNLKNSCFNKHTEKLIDSYFDKKFPSLRSAITSYVDMTESRQKAKPILKIEKPRRKLAKPTVKQADFKEVKQLALF